jgi:MFS transporter, OFA family, oxalate/formate antiporter
VLQPMRRRWIFQSAAPERAESAFVATPLGSRE